MKITRRNTLLSGAAFLASGLSFSLTPSRSFAQEPVRGGVLNVHYAFEQRVLNPAIRGGVGVNMVTSKIVEALVDLDQDGNPAPVLATEWSSSPDGMTITFRLREGVSWHDGKPFTAEDVQFSAMEMWKKHLGYSTQLQQHLEAVDTPDAHTAVFRYSRPMPLGLLLRALCDLGYVVPKHVYAEGDILENPANTAPIGTGPFRFVSYERGQHIIAERNENYWRQGFPYLDRIVWHIINDKAAAAAAIEAGRVDLSSYLSLAFSDLNRLKANPDFEVSGRGTTATTVHNTVGFNVRRKELADVRVRRAIAHAVDVEFFIRDFLYGFGNIATGPIPSSAKAFHSATGQPYPFDREKAEALLDEAGFPRGSDGTRFALKIVPVPSGEDIAMFATFIQQSLREVGIRSEIAQHDYAGAIKVVNHDWDFDLSIDGHRYRGDPAISTTVWYSSGSPKGAPWTNQWGWTSELADTLAADAAAEVDPDRRRELYMQWEKHVVEELPVWMAIERVELAATSSKVQNHHNQPRWDSGDFHDTWKAA